MLKKVGQIMVNVNCDDQEWIRRRQMRILQVRKQSSDIAKQLRERVISEERQRRLEEKNLIEAKLHIWKVKRLKNLEEMYRRAISDFGAGHKMAIEKPDPGKEIKEKHRKYLCKAKERGESALELQLKEKKEAAEKKLIPIKRKMITRKIEDLRSSLICSIPIKEPSLILRDIYAGKTFDPKKFESYEFEEPTKNNSSQEEKTKKKEAPPVKSSSDDCFPVGKIGPGKFQRKIRKKAVNQINQKSRAISYTGKGKTSKLESRRCENNWVNLGAIENLTKGEHTKDEKVSDTNLKETGSGKSSRGEKCSTEKEKLVKSDLTKKVYGIKQKSVIECHGVSLPHNCKMKDSICVVQSPRNISEVSKKKIACHKKQKLIRSGMSKPNAVELALKEEEKLLLEKTEKETRGNAAEERGNKALERQKIIKNYNELLMKLEKLSTKEKLIKSYCHIPPAHLFFSDERRREKTARKQRIMDSEFERIYHDVTGAKPDLNLNTRLNLGHSNDMKADSESGSVVTKLDFSKLDSNLKTNTPASSTESKSGRKAESNRVRFPVEEVSIKKTPSSYHFKRTKIIKGDSKALLEIDKILKKCQELRQESRSDGDTLPRQPGPELSEKKAEDLEAESISYKSIENGSIELQFCKSNTSSLCGGNRVSDIICLKSSPTRHLSAQEKAVLEDLAMGDVPRNFVGFRNNVTAWPVEEISSKKPGRRSSGRSSSTSYRSLPAEIHPKRINSLLEILALLKEREGRCTVADELIIELENLLGSLVRDAGENNLDLKEDDFRNFENNPRLNYYISKLLDMSRETVAELSLSSETDTSVPKISTFCDDKEDRSVMRAENKYLKEINDNSRTSKITRAKELEQIIRNWKNILEQNLKNCSLEEEFSLSDAEEITPECKEEDEKENKEKYEDIAKICSDRMAVLSRVLANLANKGYVPKSEQEDRQSHGEHDGDIQLPANEGQNYVVCPENKKSANFSCSYKRNKECPESKLSRTKILDFCDDRICPYRGPLNDGNNVKGQKPSVRRPADASLESLPNVMEELLKRRIITSPFRWSQGSVLSDYSPKGSCHSRKGKDGSIHDRTKHINQVNKLPDKDEQGCPRPKVNNCLYQPYKCKDSCKGSCTTDANIFEREVKESAKKFPVPEKIVQENFPEFPNKIVNRPRQRKGPISYRDSAYGIFSPVPRYYRARPKPTEVSPEMYPAYPDAFFNKKTFASRYVWDENAQTFVVNPNGRVPVPHRPFWEPRGEIPKSPGITITSVKKNPQGAPKRPRSSPVRGHERDWGSVDWSEPPVNPSKVLHFDYGPNDPYLNLTDSQGRSARDFDKEVQVNSSLHGSTPASTDKIPRRKTYSVPGFNKDSQRFTTELNEIMREWIRRNKASNLFSRNAGDRDSCAGSCAVHCKNGYNSFDHYPDSSFHGGNIRFDNYHRGANSSPDVREYERGPGREAEFSPIAYGYQEEYGEDEYEDSEDCENYDDL